MTRPLGQPGGFTAKGEGYGSTKDITATPASGPGWRAEASTGPGGEQAAQEAGPQGTGSPGSLGWGEHDHPDLSPMSDLGPEDPFVLTWQESRGQKHRGERGPLQGSLLGWRVKEEDSEDPAPPHTCLSSRAQRLAAHPPGATHGHLGQLDYW